MSSTQNKQQSDLFETREIAMLLSGRLAPGLFLLFSAIDYLYYQEHFKIFFTIRVIIFILSLTVSFLLSKKISSFMILVYSSLVVFLYSFGLFAMIVISRDIGTPYYLGLLVVLVGFGTGYSTSWNVFFVNMLIILFPSYVIAPIIIGDYNFFGTYYVYNASLTFTSCVLVYLNKMMKERIYEREEKLKLENISYKQELGDIALKLFHDIKVPIEGLKFAFNELTDPDVKKIAKDSLHYLTETCDSIMSYRFKVRHNFKKIVHVSGFVNGLKSHLESIFGRKVNFNYDIEELNKSVIIVKQNALLRAITNLVKNAIEAQGSTEVFLNISVRSNRILFEVLNNGEEVPDFVAKKLFSETISYGKSNGNGIGLKQVGDFAKEHNGNSYYLRKGNYTSFNIEFSCYERFSEIVLIDDSENIRKTWLKEALKNNVNLKVYSSYTGYKKEISALRKECVFFVDYDLGEENGVEVAKLLNNSGFDFVFISTGSSTIEIEEDVVKGIYGKEFPDFLK